MMKTILAVALSFLLCFQTVWIASAANVITYEDTTEAVPEENTAEEGNEEGIPGTGETGISAPSAILMEASTGQIIFEKDSNAALPPASVTKVMTLLLIFDALDAGKITLSDPITVSEYAASMGGSQVFLEPRETQSVDTMIKCISVASANDACVAMAEHIWGSESEFVNQMNLRAKGLGMEHTTFLNCNGLDVEGHLTTAQDIALMSRELITKYPAVRDYTTIWMENITHTTKKGSTEFGLTNTNKLIRQYQYATGLKTGSTSQAKYCVSATAEKDGMELIAVIMAAPDYKVRFVDATTLLNYGFGKCAKYVDTKTKAPEDVSVRHGMTKSVSLEIAERFRYIDTSGADLNTIKKKINLKKEIKAPVKAGDVMGTVQYFLGEKEIGSVNILAKVTVMEMTVQSALKDTLASFLL